MKKDTQTKNCTLSNFREIIIYKLKNNYTQNKILYKYNYSDHQLNPNQLSKSKPMDLTSTFF